MNYDNNTLTEQQESLLMKFVDGECAWLERRRAERLIAKSSEARSFVDSLLQVGRECSENLTCQPASSGKDMWQRVVQRLEEEERAAAFLGPRRIEREQGWFDEFVQAVLSWRGLSGAFAAAGVAFIALQYMPGKLPGGAVPGGTPIVLKDESAIGIQPVSGFGNAAAVSELNGASRSFQRPRLVADSDTIEVDWVRSRGRVRMVKDRDAGSTIIWIKQRQPVDRAYMPQFDSAGSRYPIAIPVATR